VTDNSRTGKIGRGETPRAFMLTNRRALASCALLLAWLGGTIRSHPASIPIPNGSFELPVTPFVSVNVDAWEKPPKPDWYVEEGGFL
jgi:hypothetical protein